ncbi:heat shock transcription factor [Phytophthora cinnamomi]|uniref:heat shock transcription factor n=1 Tax=Phytophthora cinnamomi TaxID=4785 RepID=UPI003559EF19|nr:heat shock transcription factor [Phytophthora cinnamomi]
MPSAKTARPAEDSSRPAAKRARLSHSRKSNKAPAVDAALPTAIAASAAACKVPKFLRSLYAILQTEDPQVVSWVQNRELTPNSVTAFHILQMERFEREILPKYFKHQKFASFQRQLNNFGFRKWTKTQSSGVCTFSHNSFPPDLSAPSSSNMSIRDQWRQKSTQVIPPPASAVGGQPVKRRIVGNGIAKAKAKQQQVGNLARRRPVNVQVPLARDIGDSPVFVEMYRSPNSNASVESSGFRHSLSHQPPLKKLARPSLKQDMAEPLNGLEAFCDDSFKQFILPPLQPHHLLSATPRGTTPSVSLTPSFSKHGDSTTGLGGFRYSLVSNNSNNNTPSTFSTDSGYPSNGFKPFDFKHVDTQPHPYPPAVSHLSSNSGAADAAALQGAFLEPWMWDAQASSSNFEIGSFPLEFDCKNEFEWQEGPGSNSFQGHATSSTANCAAPIKEPCHQNDRGVPSNTEEFGLDNLLFVE